MVTLKIKVKSSPISGRGVFATKTLRKNEIIEIAPLLVVDSKDFSRIEKTSLNDYWFDYGMEQRAFALGYASLYNHSYEPNAVYFLSDNLIKITAIKPIKKGEEIFVNYNGNHDDTTPVWFDIIN